MGVPHMQLYLTWPYLDVDVQLPAVTIDDVEARAEIGLKTMPRLLRDRAQTARAKGLEGIAQIAREGDRLAQVESPGAIVEIASTKWSQAPEVNVDVAPKNRPRVHVQHGRVSGQLERGHVRVLLPHIAGSGRRLDVWA